MQPNVIVPGGNDTNSHRPIDELGPECEHSHLQEYDPMDGGFEAMGGGDDDEADNDKGLEADEPQGPPSRHLTVDQIDSNAAEAAREAAEEYATGHDPDMGPLTETQRAQLIAYRAYTHVPMWAWDIGSRVWTVDTPVPSWGTGSYNQVSP